MLLIDCYNLIHAPMPAALAGLDESRLCRLLAGSAYREGRIVVVCDGVVKPGGPAFSPVPEVEIVYSGPGRSADAVIEQMVDQDSAPRRVSVVSDDRQVRKAARRRRCRILSCQDLAHELVSVLAARASTSGAGKPDASGLSGAEVDRWVETFEGDDEGA
jgi:predicted RNA-binding protein with PIN domain